MSKAKAVCSPLAGHFKLSFKKCPTNEKEMKEMSKVPYASDVGSVVILIVRPLGHQRRDVNLQKGRSDDGGPAASSIIKSTNTQRGRRRSSYSWDCIPSHRVDPPH